ncbi:MAG: acetyl-CoA carboxylase biotin carboxyl carrier protein [Alphaproteobacteria bacterium]|nr:acetyl-CoA carboxylase biotin carboxyl carrier protein [Alphaproteobacteria bacterium]
MNKEKIDKDMIRALAELLDETRLTEIEIEHQGLRVRVARQPGAAAPVMHYAPGAAAPAQTAQPAASENLAAHPGVVTSPMVGTAYLSPEPGATPFIAVGDAVETGQTLFIIEAMKTMNPIAAPRSGKVVRILVTDGHPVEFGEPLAIIE